MSRKQELRARYTNDGAAPIAMAFWWNRWMRVVDAAGDLVVPGRGPVLPCGVNEELEVIEPGAEVDHQVSLGASSVWYGRVHKG